MIARGDRRSAAARRGHRRPARARDRRRPAHGGATGVRRPRRRARHPSRDAGDRRRGPRQGPRRARGFTPGRARCRSGLTRRALSGPLHRLRFLGASVERLLAPRSRARSGHRPPHVLAWATPDRRRALEGSARRTRRGSPGRRASRSSSPSCQSSTRTITCGSGPTTATCCRSEEHTSELQSPYELVCRLLLEKKKKNHIALRWRIDKNLILLCLNSIFASHLPHTTIEYPYMHPHTSHHSSSVPYVVTTI